MALAPISVPNPAQAAFGLEFQSLLRIILTQLTFQDPLKPIDNFQFVSQLGQFAQLQQTQSLNEQISNLFDTQASSLAVGLLGKTVDAQLGQATVSGKVEALSFAAGRPTATIRTTEGQVIPDVAMSNIIEVR
jgi:flagellar basal-body rod modification protein FlgD